MTQLDDELFDKQAGKVITNIAIVVILGIVFTSGLLIGKLIWQKKVTLTSEKAEPAFQLKDGSKVLERKETDPKAKPETEIPKGSTLQRKIKLSVRQQDLPSSNGGMRLGGLTPWIPTSQLEIDLSVVKMPDGTTRVVGKAGDGFILDGTDQPVEPIQAPVAYKNSFHLSARLAGGGFGAVYTRDFLNRFVVGAHVNLIQEKNFRGLTTEVWVSLGYRW